MNRSPLNQDQIVNSLREVERRVSQGELLDSVLKELSIPHSSYRRWRRKYGGRAEGNAAAVTIHSAEQCGGRPALTEHAPELSAEAEKLLAAANDASGPATNAWLAFLALLAYLLVALGGVSHRDLLLNSPVKLPIVDVEVPLFSFFQYAPLLLLLLQLWLLIQHVMLAGKCRSFTAAIAPYERETGKEHPARQLIDPYVVSQIMAGPQRTLVMRWMMRLMVFVTFTFLPVVTLLYFQIKFVPYHEIGITYWHRTIVLLELAMLFGLLPIIHLKPRKSVVGLGSQGEAWRNSPLRILFSVVFAAVIVSLSWLVVTVPDEWLDQRMQFVAPISLKNGPGEETHFAYEREHLLSPIVRFAYRLIPQADTQGDEIRRIQVVYYYEDKGWLLRQLISYRVLVVEDTDLVPNEGDKDDEVSVVLRNRDLRFARLNRSDIHRADLTNSDLSGAQMVGTRLEKAKLQGAQLRNAYLWRAHLQDADLESGSLQGAVLSFAELQGANLSSAQLQRAKLDGANFKHADLSFAELEEADLAGGAQGQGADLSFAALQSADLERADLRGANLNGADLLGADLIGAELRAADLSQAKLQGADLTQAELQGADLGTAELQGADLTQAELQGADLTQAELQGADLSGAELQGADLSGAQLQGADLTDMHVWMARFPVDLANQSPVPFGVADLEMSPLTLGDKAGLRKRLEDNVTNDKLLKRLKDRLDPILRENPPEWESGGRWRQYVKEAKSTPDEFVRFLTAATRRACEDSEGYMASSMARRAENYEPQYAKQLAKALLNEHCKGARALPDQTRAKLESLASPTE